MWSRLRAAEVASLVAGMLVPLAFAPFHLYPLAVVCPALLFAVWRGVTPGRAGWRGLLFGLGMFGTGVNWVFISMYDFGGMSASLSVVITLLLIVWMALFPALAGWISVRICDHLSAAETKRFPAWIAVFPAVWALCEWLRGWLLTGFPWLNLGYSQIDAPLGGFAPLTGVYGISLATALSAALLVAVATGSDRLRGISLAALTALWLGGGSLALIDWTRQAGPPLTVSLIQGNFSQDLKWRPNLRDATLDLYARLSRGHWDSDLIVWPETAIPMYEHEARPFLDELEEEARATDTALLVGVVHQDRESKRYYNSMVTVGTGSRDRYHKHHLVPFTEYLPLKSIFGDLVDFFEIPMSDFSAGDAIQEPLAAAGEKIGLSICYEDVFGEETIRMLPEATVLLNVSNDAWFGDSIAPHQHLQIARMRAVETGRYLARSTNTGISAFIDSRGEVLSHAPQFEVAVLTERVVPRSGATPYVMTGNWSFLVLAVLLLTAGRWLPVRRSLPDV